MTLASRAWMGAEGGLGGAGGVDGVEGGLGVGEAHGVEGVRAPLALRPILPVLDDHVEGEAPRAELTHRPQQLLRRLVPLAALPVPERPAGGEGDQPRKRAPYAEPP